MTDLLSSCFISSARWGIHLCYSVITQNESALFELGLAPFVKKSNQIQSTLLVHPIKMGSPVCSTMQQKHCRILYALLCHVESFLLYMLQDKFIFMLNLFPTYINLLQPEHNNLLDFPLLNANYFNVIVKVLKQINVG